MKIKALRFYPIRFREIYKEKIWGSDGLKKCLAKRCNFRTGESWELADIDKNNSIIANGSYRGKKISWLLKHYSREILGENVYIRFKRFPLIIKFIYAQDKLSLQVHPSDDFARLYETEGTGKMEAWYVVDATNEARIIRGVLPGTTETEFRESLQNGRINECINTLRVKKDDVIFIPPGTVHSGYGGVLILEIQQASDITYRLTDWGRVDFNGRPRKLDLLKAMKAVDLQSMGVSKFKPSRIPGYKYARKLLIKCEKFTMEMIELKAGKKVKECPNSEHFKVFTVIEGGGRFLYSNKKKKKEIFKKGQTFLIPAFMPEFDIRATKRTRIVCSYT